MTNCVNTHSLNLFKKKKQSYQQKYSHSLYNEEKLDEGPDTQFLWETPLWRLTLINTSKESCQR